MCRVEYVDYIRNEYKVTTKELFQRHCPPTQGSHSDWKNGKAFSSQGILNRLEKSRKITQNTGKLKEFKINI